MDMVSSFPIYLSFNNLINYSFLAKHRYFLAKVFIILILSIFGVLISIIDADSVLWSDISMLFSFRKAVVDQVAL